MNISQYTIENPKIGTSYLVRRNKGGSLSKRFEPAQIIDIDELDGGTRIFQVKFLYDGFQTDLTAYCGLVKELDLTWVRNEHKVKRLEHEALSDALICLEMLALKV